MSCVRQSYIYIRKERNWTTPPPLLETTFFPKHRPGTHKQKSLLHHLCRCAVLFLVVHLKFLSSLSSLCWGELLQVWVCFQLLERDITGLGLFPVAGERYYRSEFVFSRWGERLQVWVCFQSLGREITGLGLFPVAGERDITGLGLFSVTGESYCRSRFVFSRWGEILQLCVCFQSLGREITALGLFPVGLSSYPTPYPGPERVQISQLVSVLLGLLQMMTIYCRYHYLSVFLLVSPLP